LGRLTVLYVKLDDQALQKIGELSQVSYLDLFGTGVTPEGAAKLARTLPAAEIDCRNGAMLGIGPPPGDDGCTIGKVVPNSGANAADIREQDLVISFDHQPVHNFTELRSLIGTKNVGQQISIEVRRGDEVLTKEATLGKWPTWPPPQ